MKKKSIVFVLLSALCFCMLHPIRAEAVGSNALGVIGDVLGIVVDVVRDSATQKELDAINNKLENNIAVTDEEITNIMNSLQNLTYSGSGALMKSFSGIAKNNYSTSWRSYNVTAKVSNDFSYFCWVDNVL